MPEAKVETVDEIIARVERRELGYLHSWLSGGCVGGISSATFDWLALVQEIRKLRIVVEQERGLKIDWPELLDELRKHPRVTR